MFSECFMVFLALFNIYSREPDFWADFQEFLKKPQTCLVGVFWEFHGILALFDIWAENRIFQPRIGVLKILKMPQSVFSWCFPSVSRYFQHCSTSGPRTGFLSREPDFQKILKKPQNMFSWCFLNFKVFLALFDIWAKNRMFEPKPDFQKFL